MSDIPRIMVAGTHSGCGKTTVSRGLMQALRRTGLVVQPFKVGPDFIDPTHHTAICGRISRNLDPFMMGEDGVAATFLAASEGADIAVIEGVMGMYDGLEGTATASTAHVMRILGTPAVLVVDVRGMSRSAHAMIAGFRTYEPGIDLAGVIFNRVGSPRHRAMIEEGLSIRALGFIPRIPDLGMESRHLGLKMAFELAEDPVPGTVVLEHCDVDGIVGIARTAPPVAAPRFPRPHCFAAATVGVARDEAFCFYYQDNLERLEAAGADLVFFSPLRDPLPDAGAYYFGGGYPELHAAALERSPCRRQVGRAAAEGIPIFAECGGLMYLCESITVGETDFRMAGVLPGTASMTPGIQALGYSDGTWTGGPALASPGRSIRGHEFHYSCVDPARDARFSIRLTRGKGIIGGRDGMYSGESVGTYTHSYFSASFAGALAGAAARDAVP
ncbi:MAG: cobyrinate a,c-diamide synthase [Methanomicrobiales archaeon]|nr:cobyrinate a,c-diamide synthase [Methanomicrobiales archaeon]